MLAFGISSPARRWTIEFNASYSTALSAEIDLNIVFLNLTNDLEVDGYYWSPSRHRNRVSSRLLQRFRPRNRQTAKAVPLLALQRTRG